MIDANAINFTWLLRLRWGAIAGQLALILGASLVVGVRMPLVTIFAIVGVEILLNLAATAWARRAARIPEVAVALAMALDVVILTVLLQLTGGPFNPFSSLYLVNIALAAVILRPGLTWLLVCFSLLCFGSMFLEIVSGPPAASHMAHGPQEMRLHVEGMWVAFGVAAGFIVYFVQRVTRALAARDAELAAARNAAARSERLASLATLSAGAAHQLSTPLSTIAVVAKELEHQLEGARADTDAITDARLIREQVDRCRDILVHMAADAGESAGEPIVDLRLDDLLADVSRGFEGRVHAEPLGPLGARILRVPARALVQTVRALVKNGCDASAASAAVEITVRAEGSLCVIEVRDRGSGMSTDVLAHAGEPFFTTKPQGHGMGLGLFLAHALAERLGGRLEIESTPRQGTTARLVVPFAGARAASVPDAGRPSLGQEPHAKEARRWS